MTVIDLKWDTLQWRHKERDGVSNHRRLDCSLICLFRRRSKKISKLRVTGRCNSPHKGRTKMFPFDDAIMCCAKASVAILVHSHTVKSPQVIEYRAPADETYRVSLQWRHNGRSSVSNHQPHDRLLNRLFRRRSKKKSKLRVTGLCVGN